MKLKSRFREVITSEARGRLSPACQIMRIARHDSTESVTGVRRQPRDRQPPTGALRRDRRRGDGREVLA